jgi:hypothetical protein
MACIAWALLSSCVEDRAVDQVPPVYAVEVAPILARACVPCHSDVAPEGGWRATSYLDTIGCVGGSADPATAPPDDRAPILTALESDAHRGVVEPAERAVLEAWVRASAPAFRGTVHPPGIVDPRSPSWHGKLLRDRR